jgi:hypothetical protein
MEQLQQLMEEEEMLQTTITLALEEAFLEYSTIQHILVKHLGHILHQ